MNYDKYIVCFSGGKDSIACFLNLLEQGVPTEKIELWHHLIDGNEGSDMMDWKVTTSYCKAFAKEFNVPIYFSWKVGGFEREMLRNSSLTAPTAFETVEGEVVMVGGVAGKPSTRRKFPQVSPDLKVRWCSAYLKIDICATAIRNQDRFNGKNICVLSGERGEESPQRAKYADLEADRSDNRDGKSKRCVDRVRPIKNWSEMQVWAIIKRWAVRVHPCYYMGWSRCSCQFCIFGGDNQMASAYKVTPCKGEKIISYEEEFGVTIKRNKSVRQSVTDGAPYAGITEELMELANSEVYAESIRMDNWLLPSGAYGESCGAF